MAPQGGCEQFCSNTFPKGTVAVTASGDLGEKTKVSNVIVSGASVRRQKVSHVSASGSEVREKVLSCNTLHCFA